MHVMDADDDQLVIDLIHAGHAIHAQRLKINVSFS